MLPYEPCRQFINRSCNTVILCNIVIAQNKFSAFIYEDPLLTFSEFYINIRIASHIHNTPNYMPIKVYVISDPPSIEYFIKDDINGFTEYLASDDMLEFPEPMYFDTIAETLAFCTGIGYGENETSIPERYPLRSCEKTDLPFIEAIEKY